MDEKLVVFEDLFVRTLGTRSGYCQAKSCSSNSNLGNSLKLWGQFLYTFTTFIVEGDMSDGKEGSSELRSANVHRAPL